MRSSAAYFLALLLPAAPLVAAFECVPDRTYCGIDLLNKGVTRDTLTTYAKEAGFRGVPTGNSLWKCRKDNTPLFERECTKICWPKADGAYCRDDWQHKIRG
ncbi:Endoplasmic reticulum membrane protein [Purpureocillium lavendulum]|uniref:Endoplasmic reticulum membrane protein n=1 Tax=Purpureocillium lavendulum TaxID=1247861 RepID=A0AB34G5Y8_9HYPO|nr:Endoplasmic reticulum membrane protein [Purpureocillium lavendulum]